MAAPPPPVDPKAALTDEQAADVVAELSDVELYEALVDTVGVDTVYARTVRRLVEVIGCPPFFYRLAVRSTDMSGADLARTLREAKDTIVHMRKRRAAEVEKRRVLARGGHMFDAVLVERDVLRNSLLSYGEKRPVLPRLTVQPTDDEEGGD